MKNHDFSLPEVWIIQLRFNLEKGVWAGRGGADLVQKINPFGSQISVLLALVGSPD